MLVPKFEITQCNKCIYIVVYAPYANVSKTEIYAEEDDFRFYSKPYMLKLKLPGEVLEHGSLSTASYDAETGNYKITLQKSICGQHFPNLEIISSLLVKKQKLFQVPRIIELESQTEGQNDHSSDCEEIVIEDQEEEQEEEEEEEEEDVEREEGDGHELATNSPKYGFGENYSQVFRGFSYEVFEILDLPHPDTTPASERLQYRLKQEDNDFDEDHYLADYAIVEEREIIMSYNPPWSNKESCYTLSVEDFDRLKEIPRHIWLKTDDYYIYLGLLDILLSYCYEIRITEGETTPESARTINKLSSTLSWFETFSTLKHVLIAFIRRSLCYTLHRSWDLSVKVIDDVKLLLQSGVLQVQKSLLHIYKLFNESEPRYLLNRIYMDDYCLWIGNVSAKKLKQMADVIEMISIKKDEVGFDLVNLEKAAQMVMEEESVSEHLTKAVGEMTISNETGSVDAVPVRFGNKNHGYAEKVRSGDCSDDEYSLDSDDLSD